MQAYEIVEGEQKTDEWQKLREGILTGSVAKKVKGTGNAYLYETLAMMTTVRDPKQAYGEHVDRGNELEPEARKAYEKATKQKVREVAFIKNGRYGLSPDGLIMKGAKIKKLLELKAPDTNNHIRYILEKTLPAEHKDQIIHGFIVCDDVDEIDFVSYCPVFKFKPLFIITVKRSEMMLDIQTTKIQYQKFIEKLDKHYSTLIL
jgi:hypothetical protein